MNLMISGSCQWRYRRYSCSILSINRRDRSQDWFKTRDLRWSRGDGTTRERFAVDCRRFLGIDLSSRTLAVCFQLFRSQVLKPS